MKKQENHQTETPSNDVEKNAVEQTNEAGANDKEASLEVVKNEEITQVETKTIEDNQDVPGQGNESGLIELQPSIDIESDSPSQISFVRKQIGPQDIKKKEAIFKVYDSLVDTANQAKFELEQLISEESMSELSLDLIIEFLKSNDPETWLVREYIQAKGMKVEFLKTEKLIESGLFDLPDYSGILAIQSEFHLWKQRLREHNFVYPFRKLFIAEDNVFILTPDFEDELKEETTTYTATENQNEVLEAIEALAKSLNDIHRMKIVNVRTQGLTMVSPQIALMLKFDRTNNETPVSVNPRAFRTNILRKFSEEPILGNKKRVDFWG